MGHVLIVDDSKALRDFMAKIVTAQGHTCHFAEDGVEAVSMAEKTNPDLILMDVVMPKQDGFQTLRKLRNDATMKEIPVVLVTSKGTESDKFWGRKQGATDHIVKPFTEAEMSKVIQKYI